MNNDGYTLHVCWDRSRVVEILLQLDNKEKVMPNNVKTQHKRMNTYIPNTLIHVICVI